MADRVTRLPCAIAMLVLLCGCNGPVRGLYPPHAGDSTDLYIVNNHWHTGFVLRGTELTPALRRLLPRFVDAQYLEIGWGDDRFYRSPESTSGLAMQALFASRGSVLHVVPLSREPEVHYREFATDLYRVQISREGHRRLLEFVEQSFDCTESSDAIELQPGWAANSFFYKARGRYNLFHTCNQWTAEGLRTTGFPITPCYAGLSENVGWQIRAFGRKHQPDPLLLHDGNPVTVVVPPVRDYN